MKQEWMNSERMNSETFKKNIHSLSCTLQRLELLKMISLGLAKMPLKMNFWRFMAEKIAYFWRMLCVIHERDSFSLLVRRK